VNRNRILAITLASIMGLACAAALSSVERRFPLPEHRIVLQATPQRNSNQKENSNQKAKVNHPVQRLGEWLESHKSLPLDQQEKALEKDPNFKKMPPARQNALRDRLRKFNSLTPDQRDLAIKRMNFWASLSKEQHEQVRDANQKLQTLPPDRRVALHKALRHLRRMDVQQRQQVMQSDRFKSLFSDQEQGILKELAAINPERGADEQGSAPTQSPRP
jgi:Protein of unknown function (DUF3106)